MLGFRRCLFNVSQNESEASEASEDDPEAVRGRLLFLESFFFLFLLSDRFISGDRKTKPSSNVFWPFSSTLFLAAAASEAVASVVLSFGPRTSFFN